MKKLLLLITILLSTNLNAQCEGDINQDNNVNVLDVIITVNHILEIENINDNLIYLIDFNSDQIINIMDVIIMVNLVLDEDFQCEECSDNNVMCIDIHSVFVIGPDNLSDIVVDDYESDHRGVFGTFSLNFTETNSNNSPCEFCGSNSCCLEMHTENCCCYPN